MSAYNSSGDEFAIYHKPYPYKEENEKYGIPLQWLLFDFSKPFCILIICITLSSLAIWYGVILFHHANESTSNIVGQCICIHRYSYLDESCFMDSEGHQQCEYWAVQEFHWKMINHSLCLNTNANHSISDDILIFDKKVHSFAVDWYYNINDTIQCYSNSECDTILIDDDVDGYDQTKTFNYVGAITLITFSAFAIISSLLCCGYDVFAFLTCKATGSGKIKFMRSEYTKDMANYIKFRKEIFKKKHNEVEWFDLSFDEKIHYFMSYYTRKYAYNVPIEINQLIAKYWIWCDYSLLLEWNLEEIMLWISCLEKNRFKKYQHKFETGFSKKGITSGIDLVKMKKSNLKEICRRKEIHNKNDIRKLMKYISALQSDEDYSRNEISIDEDCFRIALYD